MKAYIKAGILGGIVIFIWSVISWMVLPWHMTSMHSFSDEKAVSDVILANTSQTGIYILPTQAASPQKPFIFASILPQGMTSSMVTSMIIGLILQIIAATFVAWMLSKTIGLNYLQRVIFVVVFALAAGIITHGMAWNWYNFDAHYTLVLIADLLISWFLAGLIMAKICQRN